jgi:hypothetical protein
VRAMPSWYVCLLVPILCSFFFVLVVRDVIWFGKYPSGSGFEDGEHWFGWNFRISGLFFG